MWLALHETTHVFEFEAHPWLRAHLNGILEQYFEFLSQDVSQLKDGGFGTLRSFLERARVDRDRGVQPILIGRDSDERLRHNVSRRRAMLLHREPHLIDGGLDH